MTTNPNLSHEMNAAMSRRRLPLGTIGKINAVQDAVDEDRASARVAEGKMRDARQWVREAIAEEDRLAAHDRRGELVRGRHEAVPMTDPAGKTIGWELKEERVRDTARLDAAREARARAEDDLARWEPIYEARNENCRSSGYTLNAVQEHVESLPADAVIKEWHGPRAKPHNGESLVQASARVRPEIAAHKSRREEIVAAPLPMSEIMDNLTAHVRALAEKSAPTLHGLDLGRPEIRGPLQYVEGTARVPGADLGSANVRVPDVLGWVAWMFEEELIERLGSTIETTTDDETALSSDERAAKLAEIDARILDLEREEESLIEQAHEQGHVIRRRADADPRAILGVCDPIESAREAA